MIRRSLGELYVQDCGPFPDVLEVLSRLFGPRHRTRGGVARGLVHSNAPGYGFQWTEDGQAKLQVDVGLVGMFLHVSVHESGVQSWSGKKHGGCIDSLGSGWFMQMVPCSSCSVFRLMRIWSVGLSSHRTAQGSPCPQRRSWQHAQDATSQVETRRVITGLSVYIYIYTHEFAV